MTDLGTIDLAALCTLITTRREDTETAAARKRPVKARKLIDGAAAVDLPVVDSPLLPDDLPTISVEWIMSHSNCESTKDDIGAKCASFSDSSIDDAVIFGAVDIGILATLQDSDHLWSLLSDAASLSTKDTLSGSLHATFDANQALMRIVHRSQTMSTRTLLLQIVDNASPLHSVLDLMLSGSIAIFPSITSLRVEDDSTVIVNIRMFIAAPASANNDCAGSTVNLNLCKLIDILYPQDSPNDNLRATPDALLEHISRNTTPKPRRRLHIGGLASTLLPYQNHAVFWMLYREGVPVDAGGQATFPPKSPIPAYMERVSDRLVIDRIYGRIFDANSLLDAPTNIATYGGVLADEMGLGKSLEVIALVLLHPYADQDTAVNPATLIVAPLAIIGQWVREINKHAPGLRVARYKSSTSTQETIDSADIILVDYATLRSEIYRARLPPTRSMRNATEIQERWMPSFLVRRTWWRVCADEAQMAQTAGGTGVITEMMGLLPRINSWTVSGTPVRKNLADALCILAFHGVIPYQISPKARARFLAPSNIAHLYSIVASISLRRTKLQVECDISIPSQCEYVVPTSMTKLERYIYDETYQRVLIGQVDRVKSVEDVLRDIEPFLQLRKLCCHPQIGINFQCLGGRIFESMEDGGYSAIGFVSSDIPIIVHRSLLYRSIADLSAMERALCSAKVTQALVLDARQDYASALEILKTVFEESVTKAKELEQEISVRWPNQGIDTDVAEDDDDDGSSEIGLEDSNANTTLEEENQESFRQRWLGWSDLEHRSAFLMACCFHQLKDEAAEERYYALADQTRFKQLHRSLNTHDKAVAGISISAIQLEMQQSDLTWMEFKPPKYAIEDAATLAKSKLLPQPSWKAPAASGADSTNETAKSQKPKAKKTEATISKKDLFKNAMEAMQRCLSALSRQGQALMEVRKSLVSRLCRKLYNSRKDATGKEFANSLQDMDKIEKMLASYDSGIKDRRVLLLGPKKFVCGYALPHKSTRDAYIFNPYENFDSCLLSLSSLLPNGKCPNGSKAHLSRLLQPIAVLQRDCERLNSVFNAKVRYYRRLQKFSDAVILPTISGKAIETAMQSAQLAISKCEADLVYLTSHFRYISQLVKEATVASGCFICMERMVLPVVTVCGHHYCLACLLNWLNIRHTCPACRGVLGDNAYMRTQVTEVDTNEESSVHSFDARIPHIAAPSLREIEQLEINAKYGTKIDMLVRHVKFLQLEQPGCKTLLFSQWEAVLNVIGKAMALNGITFVRPSGSKKSEEIDTFSTDASIQVIMLHGKSQSSGLTLTMATNVIIFEPTDDPNLELQAINRVHRVGQTRPTQVFRYFALGTVEETLLTRLEPLPSEVLSEYRL